MPVLYLRTEINAPIERCFDLSRSIDLHRISTSHTGEEAIAGVTSGLIDLNEHVTWRATHFGILQTLTSKITEFTAPVSFTDEMTRGIFKSIVHHHRFTVEADRTIMTDEFSYEAPLGILGRLANYLVLDRYLTALLRQRNAVIKDYAESDLWKKVLID